jgi:hypothetical protein
MKDKLRGKLVGCYESTSVAAPLLLAALLLGTTPGEARAQAGGYSFEVIAFLDGPAPGGGEFTNDFEPSAINNRGDMAFTADLIVPGQEGAFLVHDGELTELIRFGEPAPGGGTFSVSELGNIGLNDKGDVAVAFTLEPLQFNPFVNAGIFRYSHVTRALTPLVLPGTPAPGGRTFLGVDFDLSMNNQGKVAFTGFTGTPDRPSRGAYVADRGGHISIVADSDTPGPSGDTFVRAANPCLNNRGDVAFSGRLSSVTGRARSIYVREASSGKIVAIATAGDPAPGGGLLATTDFPVINDRGDVVFQGFLAFDATTVFNPTALCFYHQHTLTRIAGPGDPMPGGGQVTFISALEWNVGLNNRGEVAFATGLDNGEEGLYTCSRGSIDLVAKTGTVIPGVGTIFSLEMGNPIVPGSPPAAVGWPTSGSQLNDRGQIVFGCTLEDGRGALVVATPNGNED